MVFTDIKSTIKVLPIVTSRSIKN